MRGGHAIVVALERSGIDYIFCSPGSEWPPLWEALAAAHERGAANPKYINCRHEALAVAMASGYTKATNRIQAVVLHATSGPLNAAMHLRAAMHERTPMVILSGEVAAYGENRLVPDPGGQWLHDLTDQGGSPDLLRGCVKWADRVASSELLAPTIERAVRIATAPPAGPVLIGVPFECMMDEVTIAEEGRANEVVRSHELPQASLDKALELLAAAENPVALTEYAGGDPRTVDALVELCELFAIPVMETYRPAFMNFPRTHPLYLHHDAKAVQAADLVLMVDAVTPWYPASRTPKYAKVICVSEEYPYSRLPYWGYQVDLALVAPPASTLEALVRGARSSERVARRRAVHEERRSRIRAQHDTYFDKLKQEALKHADAVPIDPRWAVHALARAIPGNAIVSEETTLHRGLTLEGIPAEQHRSYFARITGGLGVGLSYALGAKLAMPERPVFALIGDGAFHYNAVPACLGMAQEYGLPIHIVIFNNARYLSMERGLLRYFPDGAAKRTGLHLGSGMGPVPDYRHYAEAHGGFGCCVTDPQEIEAAVREALRHEKEGKLSIIDLVLSDLDPR